MKEIIYKTTKKIPLKALLDLYNDANWTAYTKNPIQLQQAIKQSLYVITAWEVQRLIGLILVVGDGLTIIYIQDILVLKSCKRQKIGTKLVQFVLEHFKAVRQKVLLTNDTAETREFYETLGFKSCDKGQLVAFMKFTN